MPWCVFLVVFLCLCCGWFRPAFRSAPRPVFLVSFLALSFVSLIASFPVLSFVSLFVSPFVAFISFGRVVGRFVWSGAVGLSFVVAGWRGVCNCGGFCRVRRFCQLMFVGVGGRLGFLSVLLVWCLVCSVRFGGAGGAFPVLWVLWVKCGCGGDVVSFLVPCCRLVLAFCFSSRVGVPCRRVFPCRCCLICAVFVSSVSRASSRLFLSLRLLFSCSSCRACRVSGVFGVGLWECVGVAVRG